MLQGENQDIVSGYAAVEQCTTFSKSLRVSVDEYAD